MQGKKRSFRGIATQCCISLIGNVNINNAVMPSEGYMRAGELRNSNLFLLGKPEKIISCK